MYFIYLSIVGNPWSVSLLLPWVKRSETDLGFPTMLFKMMHICILYIFMCDTCYFSDSFSNTCILFQIEKKKCQREVELVHSQYLKQNVVNSSEMAHAKFVVGTWSHKHGMLTTKWWKLSLLFFGGVGGGWIYNLEDGGLIVWGKDHN